MKTQQEIKCRIEYLNEKLMNIPPDCHREQADVIREMNLLKWVLE